MPNEFEIESDERGYTLIVNAPSGLHRFGITDPEALYDAVKREIGPWLYERDHARTAVAAGVSKQEYLADEYRHEVSTGQHAPFLCAVDDIDESGGYADNDPKGPRYHSIHADIWDSRAGK